jgi:hypothetical protein
MLRTIEKKVNGSHIVWFGQSNSWIQIEEPAWYVKKLHNRGIDSHTISCKLARKYNLSIIECRGFVDKICLSLTELSRPAQVSSNFNPPYFASDYSFSPYSTRHYFIGNKQFTLTFETRLTEYYIHPALAHLELKHPVKTDVEFEIFNRAGISGLREKNHHETGSTFEDFNQLKKRLFINIINAVYNKTDNDWMSLVHASALSDNKHTILLSSASGSGKSTMAALLQTRGLHLVSDDFVPIDVKTKRAFPFPAAISVKEGAFDLLSPHYGNLHNVDYNKYEYTHKSVRYLTPKSTDIATVKAMPVKSIIFIRYNPGVSCDLKLIPSKEALRLFHQQAWVSGDPNHARVFLNWFLKVQCFSLEYGNTEVGINKILELVKG